MARTNGRNGCQEWVVKNKQKEGHCLGAGHTFLVAPSGHLSGPRERLSQNNGRRKRSPKVNGEIVCAKQRESPCESWCESQRFLPRFSFRPVHGKRRNNAIHCPMAVLLSSAFFVKIWDRAPDSQGFEH